MTTLTETIANGYLYLTTGILKDGSGNTVTPGTLTLRTTDANYDSKVRTATTISYTTGNADPRDDQIMIKINLMSIERGFTKDLLPLAVTKTTNTDEPTTWFFDFKRLTETLTAQGYLKNETGSTVEYKRYELTRISRSFGTITAVWGTYDASNTYQQQSETVGISRIIINEDAKNGTERFPVTITLVVGEDKYAGSS